MPLVLTPAIGICFSMTEIFKSEVLAVVMQRVVDAPELPMVFLRTVSHTGATELTVGYSSR